MLSFTCNYVVSVRRDFLFLLMLGMGCIILLWQSLSLPYIEDITRVAISYGIIKQAFGEFDKFHMK